MHDTPSAAAPTADISAVTIEGVDDKLNVDDYALRQASIRRTGVPLPEGTSLSLWLQTVRANPLLDHRSSAELPKESDVVVIGSGLSGTLIAKHLKEAYPNQRIVVLEAREFCSGATGRNAGHCKPDQWRGFAKFEKSFGAEAAIEILENERETWENLVAYVREHNVNCDLWVGPTHDCPITDEMAILAKATFDRFKAAGGRTDHIEVIEDREEAARVSRCAQARACYTWKASTLHPWKLAAHVMNGNLQAGVELHTYTVVRAVVPSQRDGRWLVKTDRGDIDAGRVVHATNGYCGAIEPSMRGIVRPTPHACNQLVPPRPFSGSKALSASYAILDRGGSLFSINPRQNADGSVLFGGANPANGELEELIDQHPERCIDDSITGMHKISGAVKDFIAANFEGWMDAKPAPGQGFVHQWSGIIGRSADGVPFVGELPDKPGQWICAGHHGHGMARISTAAPALVKLMQGASFASTRIPRVYEITAERLARLRDAPDFSKVALI